MGRKRSNNIQKTGQAELHLTGFDRLSDIDMIKNRWLIGFNRINCQRIPENFSYIGDFTFHRDNVTF